jgi:type VI secretion system protein ImpG
VKDSPKEYYDAELKYVKEGFKEFAQQYPGVADRLRIEDDKLLDPHIERLIQAFALLTGRIRNKIEDEFPEITEGLFSVLFPHYVRPIPSMAIAKFELDEARSSATEGQTIKAGKSLFTSTTMGPGPSLRFRTAYDVKLWPLKLSSAKVLPRSALRLPLPDDTAELIHLKLECFGRGTPEAMGLDSLRFYLTGQSEIPFTLYELIVNSTLKVFVRTPDDDDAKPYGLPLNCIHPVGFRREEALLDYPSRSFSGYRLLSEFFCFPKKFLFFDLKGFKKVPIGRFGRCFDLVLAIGNVERSERFRALERIVNKDNFQLGCTPIINLFDQSAAPIRVDYAQHEYKVRAERAPVDSRELFSINTVGSVEYETRKSVEYQPFYGLRHNYQQDAQPGAFWFATRKKSSSAVDATTDVYISLVNKDFRPAELSSETLTIRATWTNGNLPKRLEEERGINELSMDGAVGVKISMSDLTESFRPPVRSGLQWRLISHLALNYLSLADLKGDSLREILRLYNFTNSPSCSNQIDGIRSIKTKPCVTRLNRPNGVSFPLGLSIQLTFDENQYSGSGVFLFASVLERFFALYSNINSFTRLTAKTQQRQGELRRWPPRAGEQILL